MNISVDNEFRTHILLLHVNHFFFDVRYKKVLPSHRVCINR